MDFIGSETITKLLSFFGIIYIGSKVIPVLKVFRDAYFSSGKKLKDFGAGEGAWVVITGCTDGIGREFSIQLAQAKFNILLISRTQSKLDELKAELCDEYGISVNTLAIDFSEQGVGKYQKVKDAIKELPIHGVINNVGLSHDHPKSFIEEDETRIQDILEINVTSTVLLTKAILTTLVQSTSASGRSGLVMTIGSFSGLVATPYLSTYSSSKAFLQTFAQALGPELEKDNILVTNVVPYFVVSKMSKIRRSSFMIPTPKAYVKSVLSKLGVSGGSVLPYNSVPYLGHAVVSLLFETFGSREFWINLNRDRMLETRAKALKRANNPKVEESTKKD